MTYVNAQSKDKKLCRTLVLHYIDLLQQRTPLILSLPADNFIFEKQVMIGYPQARITCLEHSDEVIDTVNKSGILSTLSKFIRYEKGDVLDHLCMYPEYYDLAWLDLCGPISKSVYFKLISLVQRLKRNSYLAITLLQAREPTSSMKELMEFIGCRTVSDLREGLIEQMEFSAKQTNRRLTIVEHKQYFSDNGSPMVLIIFKTT